MTTQLFINALMMFFGLHIIHTYLTSFRRETIYNKAFRYAAWAIYILFQSIVMFLHSRYPLFTLFGNIILVAGLLLSSGCVDIKTALFRSCILYASWMAVEVVTQSLLLAALGEDPFAAGHLISNITMYVIIQMYKRWKGRDLTAPLSFRHWIKLLFVPVSSMLITYYAYAITLHSG